MMLPSASFFISLLLATGLTAQAAGPATRPLRRSYQAVRSLAHDVRSVAGDAGLFARDFSDCLRGQSESEFCAPLKMGVDAVTSISDDVSNCLVSEDADAASCARLEKRYQKIRSSTKSARSVARRAASKLIRSGSALKKRHAMIARDVADGGGSSPLLAIPTSLVSYAGNYLTTTVASWALNSYMKFLRETSAEASPAQPGSVPARRSKRLFGSY